MKIKFEKISRLPVFELEGAKCFLDTGAAYSYVPGQWEGCAAVGVVEDCGFGGRPWKTEAHKVPCVFEGVEFAALCGNLEDNLEGVPPEGVIGTDFFEKFTIVVDRVAGIMQYVVNA